MEKGLLDETRVQEILECQERTGRPFGLLAEKLFDLDPAVIEDAWAQQYAATTRTIDPLVEVFDSEALALVTRRQAWQFRVLPVRFDGNELMMATAPAHLCRALRFATNVVNVPVYLVMAEPDRLGQALCRHFPLPGMSVDSIGGDEFGRMIRQYRKSA